LVEYKTKKEKVKIICLDHGVFEQKASVHLSGHGCPICRNSKLERYLRDNLIRLGITFEQNKRYEDCRNYLPLPFDFYLSDMNILIECDGIQHRVPIKHFGGEERYEYQKLNDSIKNKYCFEKSIRLIRVSNFHEIDYQLSKLYEIKNISDMKIGLDLTKLRSDEYIEKKTIEFLDEYK
jgi:very-short-patch-repair endonuclease